MEHRKYVLVTVSGIITQIAKETAIEGYTEGVIEIFFPDDLEKQSKKNQNKWIIENNNRMKAICNYLNETQF